MSQAWVLILWEGLAGPQWAPLDLPLHPALAGPEGLTDVLILIQEGT